MKTQDTIPTPIVDKNGKLTTVHRSARPTGSPSRIPSTPPSASHDVIDIDYIDIEEEPRSSQPVQTYTIGPSQVDSFKHVIDKANRRLERSGASERFEYELFSEIERHDDGTFSEMIRVDLNKPVIKQDGWSFSAAHDFTPSGDVVSHWATKRPEDHVRPEDTHCDQCGADRRRERIYTITNAAGETKQIGSNCIAGFLGLRPEGLWALTDTKIEDELAEIEEQRSLSGGTQGVLYKLDDVISVALHETNDGADYVSKAKGSLYDPPSANKVFDELQRKGEDRVTARHTNDVISFIRDMEDDGSDYVENLKAIFGAGEDETFVKGRHIGMAASAVAAWYRHNNKVEYEKVAYKQEYLAPVKTRIRGDINFTVIKKREFESDYGTQTMFVFKDDQDRLVKWTTSSPPDVWEGGQVKMTAATVKSHGEYNGDLQTVISRPIVDNVSSVGKAPSWKLDAMAFDVFRGMESGEEKEALITKFEESSGEDRLRMVREITGDNSLLSD